MARAALRFGVWDLGVEGLGFRVEGLGFRIQGVGFTVLSLGFRIWGLRVKVSEFSSSGLGFRGPHKPFPDKSTYTRRYGDVYK